MRMKISKTESERLVILETKNLSQQDLILFQTMTPQTKRSIAS